MMNANGADGSAATRSQKSAQQRLRRLQNNQLLNDWYDPNIEMTDREIERGRRLHLARLRKNRQQRERNRRAAEEKGESENVCLAATPAEAEETLISVKVKATSLCCFEGCDNQIRAGGVCSRHGAKQTRRTCSMEGCTNHARSKGDLCVTHGAKTKRCSHEGCTKQVVRGGKCTGHAESAKTFVGSCSIEGCRTSGTMIKAGKVLVCGKYPCMSHSGKGVKCKAAGCPKYVRPVPQGETRQIMCVFHRDMILKRCIYPKCVNDALQGGVCQCHGANAKLCCYYVKLFDETTKEWKVSQCNNYARKGGLCSRHGANKPVLTCVRRKEKLFQNEGWDVQRRVVQCTNLQSKNGAGICYDCYLETLI